MTTISSGAVAWPIESDAIEKPVWDNCNSQVGHQLIILREQIRKVSSHDHLNCLTMSFVHSRFHCFHVISVLQQTAEAFNDKLEMTHHFLLNTSGCDSLTVI